MASEVRERKRERNRERTREREKEKKTITLTLSPHKKNVFSKKGIWVYYIYFVFGSTLFPGTSKEGAGLSMPPRSAVLEQIRVASRAMPLYALLPSVVESLAERGATASFSRVDRDVGGILPHVLLVACYMTFVEWGVYWVHRGLHDWKTGYRYGGVMFFFRAEKRGFFE